MHESKLLIWIVFSHLNNTKFYVAFDKFEDIYLKQIVEHGFFPLFIFSENKK